MKFLSKHQNESGAPCATPTTKRSRRSFAVLALSLAAAAALALAGCSSSSSESSDTEADSSTDTTDAQVITVAASPTPHAEILNAVADQLAEQGYTLEVQEFTDYVLPNTATEEGEVDANFFQHTPYLDEFNAEQGTHLVAVTAVHYEPMGLYAGKTTSLDDLQDGATVAIPNDATNEARALLLLEQEGLITLSEDAGITATPSDIVDNPKNLQFEELEAAVVPTVLSDVDIAAINGNYAQGANLEVSDALAVEASDSLAAETYANVLVVKEGNEDDPGIQALAEALTSEETRSFIEENYAGAVVPVF